LRHWAITRIAGSDVSDQAIMENPALRIFNKSFGMMVGAE
jgi:hypothetical protein